MVTASESERAAEEERPCRYRGIVFDFDGTLADSLEAIHVAMAAAFAEAGLRPPGKAELARQIGVPLPQIIEGLLPAGRRVPELVGSLRERYLTIQRPQLARLLRLFPGCRELLDALARRGVRRAVASNKARDDLLQHLALLDIAHLFEEVVAGDDHPPELRKPHPAPLLELMQRLGLSCTDVLMVGDTIYDVRMACAAGCDCAAVTYGCHERAALAAEGPTYLVASLAELKQLLLG